MRVKGPEPYDDLLVDLLVYALREYQRNGYNVDEAIDSAGDWLIEQMDARNYHLSYAKHALMMARVIRLFDWRYSI